MKDRFIDFLQEWVPDYAERKFLLAVSGGVDSMVMTELFRNCGLSVAVAHMNFSLRDAASDEDEQWVEQYCEQRGIEIYLSKVDTKMYAEKKGVSIQMAARELRYNWFNTLLEEGAGDYLCTAHHLDDSMETILFNLAKGTGISGLTGIPVRTEKIIRPLLFCSKEEILSFAAEIELSWREDQSNQKAEYHRNAIRLQVMPLFKQINPGLFTTFKDTLGRLQATRSLLEKVMESWAESCMEEKEGAVHIHKYIFSSMTSSESVLFLQYLLDPYGFNYRQCKDIQSTLGHQSGGEFYSSEFRVVNDRESLILDKNPPISEEKHSIVVNEVDMEFTFMERSYRIYVRQIEENWRPDYSKKRMELDKGEVEFPIRVRGWQQGDQFIPLGMKGKKKISDFMIDRKIPVNFKHKVAIVESSSQIIALLGHEISDQVKVTSSTREVIVIEEL